MPLQSKFDLALVNFVPILIFRLVETFQTEYVAQRDGYALELFGVNLSAFIKIQ